MLRLSGGQGTLRSVPGLILPPTVAPAKPHRQRNECRLCGFQCDADYTRQFLHHVKKCAGEHEEQMHEVVADQAQTIFTGQSPDPERDVHFARGGN
jgi:hypothetical protein